MLRRLKPRDVEELGGGLGIPEREDEESVLREKCNALVEMIYDAVETGADACTGVSTIKKEEQKEEEEDNSNRRRHGVVVFTGAGISTACGIPDFRGPNGVWTAKAEGRPPPTGTTPFGAARPSFTHMALLALLHAGYVKFIVSQNVDGLHVRSGLRRKEHLAEIHGNAFVEKCEKCGVEYIRDFPVETLGFRCTPRRCVAVVGGNDDEACGTCGGRLRDMNLDWESPLPDDEYDMSVDHTKSAKLCLCIGTSLRITPICRVPQKAERMAIVNLQPIPMDKKAALVVRGKCDAIMRNVVSKLELHPLPVWRRWDGLRCQYALRTNPKQTAGTSSRALALEVRVGGHGGDGCLAPWLEAVVARFPPGRGMPKGGALKFLRSKSTFVLRRSISPACLPLPLVLEMRVNDSYFSDPIREIMRSTPSAAQLDKLGLSGSSLVDGHLIRTVSMDIESMPSEASITTEYLGDEYLPV